MRLPVVLFLLAALVTAPVCSSSFSSSHLSPSPCRPTVNTQASLDVDACIEEYFDSSTPGGSATVPSQPNPSSTSTRAPVYEPRHSLIVLDDAAESASVDAASSGGVPTESAHSFHPLQSTAEFTLERLTAVAPWSNRIQPAMVYLPRPLSYVQVDSGINITVSEGALLLFEGAFRTVVNGTAVIENDSWISHDDGTTWDLIGGYSQFGRSGPVHAASTAASFDGRSGANNCADPLSSIVYSIGGVGVDGSPTNTVYRSTDGQQWRRQANTFSPPRYFSSCDVDESGHVYVIGGNAVVNGQSVLLNDVWQGSVGSAGGGWRRLTDAAPFRAREEHLVLVTNSTALKRELIYVIGGEVECLNFDCSDSYDGNDVWASSDSGQTWAVISATPPFKGRWGHGGVITRAGVLVMWGGSTADSGKYEDTYTHREVWASFDGGYVWNSCALPSAVQDRLSIRTEQGAVLNSRGQLVISAGYAYAENGSFQVRYRDVWRTTFSLEDTRALAERCGGVSVIPAAGAGLRSWPGLSPVNERTTLSFTPSTRRAPWSPRIQPALLVLNASQSYVSAVDGSTQSTGRPWLVMYEGSLIATYDERSNSNDVWGSGDGGATWSLLSGIARQSLHGYKESAARDSSFRARAGSTNCVDPTTESLYSIGGGYYLNDGTRVETADTWPARTYITLPCAPRTLPLCSLPALRPACFRLTRALCCSVDRSSTDAIHWRQSTGRSFSPARHFTSCDVDTRSQVFLVGGAYFDESQPSGSAYLNDIWSYKGQAWSRVTGRAPFAARSEHVLQVARSEAYDTDLLYVSGGFTIAGDTLNDVWVSSDSAASWTQLTSRAAWSKRWGHGAAITAAGVFLVIGGTPATKGVNGNSAADMWASFDGGVRWSSCRVPSNAPFIRGEQGVSLTADERLLVGSGYQYINSGQQRIDYSDLWRSDVSLADPATVARYCGGGLPEAGVGLRGVEGWESSGSGTGSNSGTSTDTGSSAGLSAPVIGLLVAIGVGLVLAAFLYFRKRAGAVGAFWPFAGSPAQQPQYDKDTQLLAHDGISV